MLTIIPVAYRFFLHSVEQEVEWLYAFDVHCNSFFLLFLVVYVIQVVSTLCNFCGFSMMSSFEKQFFSLPILLSNSFVSLVLSNLLYGVGFGAYYYVTFEGYMGVWSPLITSFLHVKLVFNLFSSTILGQN